MNRKVLLNNSDSIILDSLNWEEIAFDTETSIEKISNEMYNNPEMPNKGCSGALKQTELVITGISLCDGKNNIYIPLHLKNRDYWMKLLKDKFSKTKKLIAHNIIFDLRVLHKYNITFSDNVKFFDTLIAHHLLDENSPHGLKHLTRTLLGRNVSDYDEELNHYTKQFYEYALDDSLNTWLLYQELLPKIFEEKLDYLMFKIEMPFQRVLLEMALEGVLIDTELLRKQQKILEREITNLTTQMYDFLGERYTMQLDLNNRQPVIVGSINFNSSQQLVKIFEKLNIPITEKTPGGNPSVGKFTLMKNKSHPFVKLLQKYKDMSKLYNSFVSEEGQIVRNLEKDNKVRPNFLDFGTKTGRLSSNNPNLQQLPNNKDDIPVNVREVFVAPKGYKMISCDYSGQEIYTMAHISKDKELIKMLRLNQDQHLVNANAVFKLGLTDEQLIKGTKLYDEVKEKYHDYRKKGKIFSFGVPYGMGAHKFSNDFQVSEEEAQEMIDNLASKFPELFQCIEDTHKTVSETFQVRHLAGRVRHFGENFSKVKLKNKNLSKYNDDIIRLMKEGAAHRQSFNFLIQGLGADMIRAASVNVYVRKKEHPEWGLKQIMTVHDESDFIVKEEYAEEAAKLIKEAFEWTTRKFIVPLKADIVIGNNYGDSK